MLEQVQLSQEAIHILSLSPGSRTEEQLQTVSRLIDELRLDRIYLLAFQVLYETRKTVFDHRSKY